MQLLLVNEEQEERVSSIRIPELTFSQWDKEMKLVQGPKKRTRIISSDSFTRINNEHFFPLKSH